MKTIADLQRQEERLIALIADRASPAGEKAAAVTALAKVQEELEALGAPRRSAPSPPPPPRETRISRPFRAKFAGFCWSCELRFPPGTSIVAIGEDRQWVHATCASRWQ